MTFAIYIILFLGFFTAALNLLPTAGAVPTLISSSVSLIVGYMRAWNFLFPINELLTCVGIVIGFELVVWGWQALKYVIKILRGTNEGA